MTPTHVDCRNCRWHSGVTGVENNCFGLGLIQQQLMARRPTLDVDASIRRVAISASQGWFRGKST